MPEVRIITAEHGGGGDEIRARQFAAEADMVLRRYGVRCSTEAETRARVGVLDRMGALSPWERYVLVEAGRL
jgi:hypothetical protein